MFQRTQIRPNLSRSRHLSRLTVTDANGNVATGAVTRAKAVRVVAGNAIFPDELSNPNISGAMADPDLDGVNSRFEYALGLDPKGA